MEILGDVGHVESHCGLMEKMFVSVQDRCTVYDNCTIGSENPFGHTRW
jgi:hypothetical protein